MFHALAEPLTPSRDSPASLRSSDIGPVEASIEDLSFKPSREPVLEIDAAPSSSPNLEIKLAQEYNYHKYGSRIDEPDFTYNPLPQQPASSRWLGDVPSQVSSVTSWTKLTPYPNPEEEVLWRSAAAASSFDGVHRPENADHFSGLDSEYNRPQHPLYDRMKSCPEGGFPVAEPLMLDSNPGLRCSAPVICPASDSGTGSVTLSLYFIILGPKGSFLVPYLHFINFNGVVLGPCFGAYLNNKEWFCYIANIIIALVMHYAKQS